MSKLYLTECLFADDSHDELAVLDEDAGVSGRDPVVGPVVLVVGVGGVEPHAVDVACR